MSLPAYRQTIRRILGLALLLNAAPRGAQAQSDAPRDTMGLRPAFARIDRFVEQAMAAQRTPGMALALVDRRGVLTVRSYGYAELERRLPVTADTRFEIGSISKSFTAIALLQEVEAGRLDLRRPVQQYLPWFTPATRWRPVTPHDLLTHTAGLPADRDDVPSSPAQAYAARERTLGSAPGTHWAYSNIGYQILGVLLEKLTGMPYAAVIQGRILDPLKMTASRAQFTDSTRPFMAHGYVPLHDDRPARATDLLVPAPWIEYGSGDGSIIATAPDLGRYLVMLLNRDHLLSEASWRRMMLPAAPTGGGGSYGYGMFIDSLDGRPVFAHSGGMLGYTSYLIGDATQGIGAVVFVNGPGSPGASARFALSALGAAMRGDSLPAVRPEDSPTHVKHPERYAGVYRMPDGDSLVLAAEGDSLLLLRGGERFALEPYDDDAFLVPGSNFSLFPLRFAGDSSGMTEAWYGGDWYVAERYAGPRRFAVPGSWQAYAGHYRIMQPWEPSFRVVVRKGMLWAITPDGTERALSLLPGGEYRIGGPQSAERLRFGPVVEGRALSADWSGMRYYRYFAP